MSPERADRLSASPFAGLVETVSSPQGSVARCRVRLHPGLCCPAPAALEIIDAVTIDSIVTGHYYGNGVPGVSPGNVTWRSSDAAS